MVFSSLRVWFHGLASASDIAAVSSFTAAKLIPGHQEDDSSPTYCLQLQLTKDISQTFDFKLEGFLCVYVYIYIYMHVCVRM